MTATFIPNDSSLFYAGFSTAINSLQLFHNAAAVSIVSVAPEPSAVGQSYSVQVSVAPVAPATITPTGNVVVSDGAGSTCTIPLPAATCSLTGATAGTRTLTATYQGDASYSQVTSASVAHGVGTVPPSISGFSPSAASVGSAITIAGAHFDPDAANDTVAFNGITAVVTSATTSSLTASVPSGASTGPLQVTVAGLTATSVTNFVVTPGLAITGFSPGSGSLGTSVIVAGQGFDATVASNNAVTFNGTAAVITQAATDHVVATVPFGASSGPIVVTVAGTSVSSATNFVVTTPGVSISGFSPANGVVGIPVTIAGLGFDPTNPANNIVRFNGVDAAITQYSGTQLVALVPQGSLTSAEVADLTASTRRPTEATMIEPDSGIGSARRFLSCYEEIVVGWIFRASLATGAKQTAGECAITLLLRLTDRTTSRAARAMTAAASGAVSRIVDGHTA